MNTSQPILVGPPTVQQPMANNNSKRMVIHHSVYLLAQTCLPLANVALEPVNQRGEEMRGKVKEGGPAEGFSWRD